MNWYQKCVVVFVGLGGDRNIIISGYISNLDKYLQQSGDVKRGSKNLNSFQNRVLEIDYPKS